MSRWITWLLAAVTAALLLAAPGAVPRLWFDEGWNLSVARILAETGVYAERELGQFVAADVLSVGPPVIVPLALGFRAFGVGLWQARAPGILFTALAFALLYGLACRLYNRRVASAALFVALFMTGAHIHLHPILLGRQALGETPALVYLLIGYAALAGGWRARPALIAVSVLGWSLGLASKPQTLPFFLASLLIPLIVAAARRDRRWVGMLFATLVATLAGYIVVSALPSLLLPEALRPESRLLATFQGVAGRRTNTNWEMAFVTSLTVHLDALKAAQTILLPLAGGCGYACWRALAAIRSPRAAARQPLADVEMARLALLALTGAWLVWWAALSVGWLRYLSSSLFVGSIFTAALLHDVTGGFSLAQIGKPFAGLWAGRPRGRAGLTILVMLALLAAVGWAVDTTARTLYTAYIREPDTSLLHLTAYLNAELPPDTTIETFESELFFLLEQPYHFPPADVQFQLNRRAFLKEDVAVTYDPLQADPDILVLGPLGKLWKLYDGVIAAQAFQLVRRAGPYEVYARVRDGSSRR